MVVEVVEWMMLWIGIIVLFICFGLLQYYYYFYYYYLRRARGIVGGGGGEFVVVFYNANTRGVELLRYSCEAYTENNGQIQGDLI